MRVTQVQIEALNPRVSFVLDGGETWHQVIISEDVARARIVWQSTQITSTTPSWVKVLPGVGTFLNELDGKWHLNAGTVYYAFIQSDLGISAAVIFTTTVAPDEVNLTTFDTDYGEFLEEIRIDLELESRLPASKAIGYSGLIRFVGVKASLQKRGAAPRF